VRHLAKMGNVAESELVAHGLTAMVCSSSVWCVDSELICLLWVIQSNTPIVSVVMGLQAAVALFQRLEVAMY